MVQTRAHVLSRSKEKKVCLFIMVRNRDNTNPVAVLQPSHTCDVSCLGPLTFHSQAVGDNVRLSRGCQLARRTGSTFRDGLVFSSRPVRVQERIRLRVEEDINQWQGALRVGFTSVSPMSRSLPLPELVIPILTDCPGHWAVHVQESYCRAGTELEFWVSHGGSIHVQINNERPKKLFTGVDLSRPLWAMIDIYGQTRSILLLGSKKTCRVFTRKSCPVHEHLDFLDTGAPHSWSPDIDRDCSSCPSTEIPADVDREMDCVVCMARRARVWLPCGHKCLCKHCFLRVIEEFGNCPLCRHKIRAPSLADTHNKNCFSASLGPC